MNAARLRTLLARIDVEARTLPPGRRNRILNLTDRVKVEIRKEERKQLKHKEL